MAGKTTNAGDEASVAVGVEETAEPMTIPEKFYDNVFDLATKLASSEFGQFSIDKLDKALNVVEATAKWSLPQQIESDENAPAPAELERPLGWVPFLAVIVMLRSMRIALSIGSLLIGNNPVSPSDMVRFVQSRRRKLRAIKYRGLRAIRMREQQAIGQKSTSGVIAKLTSLLTIVVCRPGRNRDKSDVRVIHRNTSSQGKGELNATEKQTPKKRRLREDDSEYDDDEDMPFDQLLDKYGGTASDIDDEDFVPDTNQVDTSATSDDDDENEENAHDSSVEVKENGDSTEMPKPIKEVKKEKTEADAAEEHHTSSSVAVQNGGPASDDNHDETNQPSAAGNNLPAGSKLPEGLHLQISKCISYYYPPNSPLSMSPATSSEEDLFFSPIGTPNFDKNFDFGESKATGESNETGSKVEGHEHENIENDEPHQQNQRDRSNYYHNNKKHYNNYNSANNSNKFKGKRNR